MSYALDLTDAPVNFTDAATLACPGARTLKVTVANAAVYIQTGKGFGAPSFTNDPEFTLPGVHTMPGADALRFKAAAPIVAGHEPRVAIAAYT